MLLDFLDGRGITDRSDPADLITPLNRIARLQAIKCAPDDGSRGSPTGAMSHNSPALLLRQELRCCSPRSCSRSVGQRSMRLGISRVIAGSRAAGVSGEQLSRSRARRAMCTR
jgi:hypothetical protein